MSFEHFISVAPATIRRSLVDDLQHIIRDHRGWLNQVSQAAVNKMPSLSPQIENERSETLCTMGLWVRKIAAARLDSHAAIKPLIEHHNAMHEIARKINLQADRSQSSIAEYESFLIEQFKFFTDMNAFLEVAIRDQALFHYTSRMIRSQHAEELFMQTVVHLQSQPDDEQKGCVAVVNIDPKRNIEREFGAKGVHDAIHEIATRFKSTARQSDSVVEDSENTIVIIFPGMDITNAQSILSRITRKVIERDITVQESAVKPMLAIGAVNIDINDINGTCMKIAKELSVKAATEGEMLKLARFKGRK